MSDVTLNLPIRPETQKKLKAYAMLTDRNVSQIESQLADLLDQVLTQECFELLGGTGALPRRAQPAEASFEPDTGEEKATSKPKARRKKKSFADAEKRANANPVEEHQEEFKGLDDVSGHELSSDEDSGETKSLEELYEDEVKKTAQPETAQTKNAQPKSKAKSRPEKASLQNLFEDDGVPDVGENAEAFLEAAMGIEPEEELSPEPAPQGARQFGAYGPAPRAATKSFEARRKKGQMASIQPMTGDED